MYENSNIVKNQTLDKLDNVFPKLNFITKVFLDSETTKKERNIAREKLGKINSLINLTEEGR